MTGGSPERAPVLVLGLGNLLLGDDAAGLRLLERMKGESECGAAVEFVDGGTQGLALVGQLEGRDAVLILDAVGRGAAPGTVHVLWDDEIAELRARRATTAHEGNALELLEAARLIGCAPVRVGVIGIEPEVVRTEIGLSAAVEGAMAEAEKAAREALRLVQSKLR